MSTTFSKLVPLDFEGYHLYGNIREAIENYYYHKLHPGGFVYHMLCNDFVGAVARADPFNSVQMKENVRWLSTCMPPSAWGSKEMVDNWLTSSDNA